MIDHDTTTQLQLSKPCERTPKWFIQPRRRYRISWWDAFYLGGWARCAQWANTWTIVYIVRCDGMPVYIGQTNRSIRRRMGEHWSAHTQVRRLFEEYNESAWTIVIWEYANIYHARNAERRLIKLYEPQCNLLESQRCTSLEHPSEERDRLMRMYERRAEWQAYYEKCLRYADHATMYDCYLTLPNLDVMERIAAKRADQRKAQEEAMASRSPEALQSALATIDRIFAAKQKYLLGQAPKITAASDAECAS